MCGWDVKKATEIVTLPIHVKLAGVYVHTLEYVNSLNFVNVGYEIKLCYKCRHSNEGTVQFCSFETVCVDQKSHYQNCHTTNTSVTEVYLIRVKCTRTKTLS